MYEIDGFITLTSTTAHYARFANQGGGIRTLELGEAPALPEFECNCGARNCGCDEWLDGPRSRSEARREDPRMRSAAIKLSVNERIA